jgi:nitroimidazol reductase NimA-like FMN-containing flavoprotein (pyridoxamine 5'-phosphate oxidase superfamily)
MLIHELSEAECLAVLKHAVHGRLACARDDQPYVVPFSFVLDQPRRALYAVSAPGQKIDWMRANPKVCVEVDDVADQFTWITVVAFGRYEELGDSTIDREDRQRASDLLRRRDQWWLPGLGNLASGKGPDTAIVYRILLGRLTGRRTKRN